MTAPWTQEIRDALALIEAAAQTQCREVEVTFSKGGVSITVKAKK